MHSASGAGVPEGWRQSDRFVGFRYQLSVSKNNKEEDVTIAIQNKAGKYVLSMISCLQYVVLVIWLLHLTYIGLYLIAFTNHILTEVTIILYLSSSL